jgi:hypothetical protein
VNFKVGFEAKHEGGHYVKVKFDWITVGPPATDDQPQAINT